jgi:hypothetical protein
MTEFHEVRSISDRIETQEDLDKYLLNFDEADAQLIRNSLGDIKFPLIMALYPKSDLPLPDNIYTLGPCRFYGEDL